MLKVFLAVLASLAGAFATSAHAGDESSNAEAVRGELIEFSGVNRACGPYFASDERIEHKLLQIRGVTPAGQATMLLAPVALLDIKVAIEQNLEKPRVVLLPPEFKVAFVRMTIDDLEKAECLIQHILFFPPKVAAVGTIPTR